MSRGKAVTSRSRSLCRVSDWNGCTPNEPRHSAEPAIFATASASRQRPYRVWRDGAPFVLTLKPCIDNLIERPLRAFSHSDSRHFAVPFTSKSLFTAQRSARVSMDDLASLFSLNNWPGHLSYVLIAVSYWLTDMFWLRLVAVVGLTLEILYFILSGGDLRTGIGWDLIFIAINAYQIYRLMQDRLSLRLPETYCELLRSVLGLDDAQIARLLFAGDFLPSPRVQCLTTGISPSKGYSSFARAM